MPGENRYGFYAQGNVKMAIASLLAFAFAFELARADDYDPASPENSNADKFGIALIVTMTVVMAVACSAASYFCLTKPNEKPKDVEAGVNPVTETTSLRPSLG